MGFVVQVLRSFVLLIHHHTRLDIIIIIIIIIVGCFDEINLAENMIKLLAI